MSGQSWGYEVVVRRASISCSPTAAEMKTMREWEKAGIRRAGSKPFPRASDRAFLLVPAGAQGPAFLMLQNFRSIMKYNPSEAYALAIGHLADRLRGGEPFVQAWPRHERVLTRAERLELQQHLARNGYDVGEPDGRFGPRTRNALRAFQAASGRRRTGSLPRDARPAAGPLVHDPEQARTGFRTRSVHRRDHAQVNEAAAAWWRPKIPVNSDLWVTGRVIFQLTFLS